MTADQTVKTRIRTIRDAISMIKEKDPSSAITYHFVRKLCDNGQVATLRAGKKILINYDELLVFLGMSEA